MKDERRSFGRFLKNQNILVRLVDAEHVRITEWAHIVVLVAAVPDNQVVKNETDLLHLACQVGMKWIELVFLPQVHHDNRTIFARLERAENRTKSFRQRVQEFVVIWVVSL